MKNAVAGRESQSRVDEWACWRPVTLEVKFCDWRATHAPSRTTKKRRVETRGLLSAARVSTKGRSEDGAPDSGVTGQS